MAKRTQTIGLEVAEIAPRIGHSTIGATSQPLIDASVPTDLGVWVKAAPGNTGIVYLVSGNDSLGYPLNKGDEKFLPVKDVDLIRVCAASSGDTLSYLAL